MNSFLRKTILNRKFLIISGIVLLELALAVLITFFIEFSNKLGDFDATWQFIIDQTKIFAFDVGVITFISLILTAIFNSVIVGNGILFAFSYALMFANTQKLTWREFPILPEDFMLLSEADSLMDLVSKNDLILTGFVVASVVIFTIVISRLLKKKLSVPTFKNRWMIISRIAVLVVGTVGLVSLTAPIRGLYSGSSSVAVPWLNTSIEIWSQSSSYRRNGFILSFVYNIEQRQMDKPEGYSKERIQEIVEKYKNLEDGPMLSQNLDLNIVYIMSESFSDPSKLAEEFPFTGNDPIRFTHSLMSKTTSGQISTPAFGGDTANVEFEALTGMSMYYVDAIPYTNMAARQTGLPSVVSLLENYDYQTTAMHAFDGRMYKRNIVYKNFGFDKFISNAEMPNHQEELFNGYISDKYVFNLIKDQLKASDKNQFIFLVSMQNHVPYHGTVPSDEFHSIADVDDSKKANINSYMTAINESDKALENFITEVDNMSKNTIVVFWGDHLPGVYGEKNDNDSEKLLERYQTPAFIYANFDFDHKDIGVISPIFINNEMLTMAGIKKPPFYQMLSALEQKSKIINRRVSDIIPVNESEVLEDYRLIEYDVLSGEKYAINLGFFD